LGALGHLQSLRLLQYDYLTNLTSGANYRIHINHGTLTNFSADVYNRTIIITALLPMVTPSLIIAPGSILASIFLTSSIGIAEFRLSLFQPEIHNVSLCSSMKFSTLLLSPKIT